LAECGRRAPRLPLAGEADARKVLPATWGDGPPPNWVRLLAVSPRQGAGRVQSLHTAEHKGLLGPALRGQIAWVAARHDRAWYAVGLAQRQLRQAGQADDAIFALDGDWSSF